MLANRLRKVLSFVISTEQRASVDGKHILDSIFIVHSCLHSRHKTKQPGLVCKLDFEKVDDMVE